MFEQFNMLALQQEATASDLSRTDVPSETYYNNCTGKRTNTDALLVATIRAANPGLEVTVLPKYSSNLAAFVASGQATMTPIVDTSNPKTSAPLAWQVYSPPAQRLNGDQGVIETVIKFGKFAYSYKGREYILYLADGRDTPFTYDNQYLLSPADVEAQAKVQELIYAVGQWTFSLHNEIWVFDQGYWQKSRDLWESIQKARWEDVIMEDEDKKTLRNDAIRFFDGQQRYDRYRIAWKRGVIYYGPPGNGKTISIKALAHELSSRPAPITTLYVKSLVSFSGPQYSIQRIFSLARTEAPCLLVFEDLDSLITDAVRSYFLNEVDGLSANTGVYMVGSTNHMDRLDPGISKRPSRFDRKFEFSKPNESQRVAYAEFWRRKLTADRDADAGDRDGDGEREEQQEEEEEEDLVHVGVDVDVDPNSVSTSDLDAEGGNVEFPKELSPEIARITDGFSFAYLQEAFVASLLVIAGMDDDDDNKNNTNNNDDKGKDKFEHLLLWRVIKKQIALLREQI